MKASVGETMNPLSEAEWASEAGGGGDDGSVSPPEDNGGGERQLLDAKANIIPESLEFIDNEQGQAIQEWRDSLVAKNVGKENERDRRKRIALEQLANSSLISPESSFRRQWDLAQIFLLVYVAIGVPYRLGFEVDVSCWTFWFWFDLIVDIYFIADVFVSFRTCYYNKRGDLVVSVPHIRRNYMFAPPYWFWIDVAACFPGNYIGWITNGCGGEASSAARGNKMIRLLRMLRLLKLLRLARFNRLLQRYEEELYSLLTTMKLGKIVVVMFLVGHWLACCWYAAGTISSDYDCIGDSGVSEKCKGWVDRRWGDGTKDRLALESNGTAVFANEFTRYSTAIYWSIMTMTTVGYGDIVPATEYESIMSIIGMIIGGFMFGMIVGNLAELAKRSNAAELMRQKNLARVAAVLRCGAATSVTPDLQRRVRAYFSSYYQQRTAMNLYQYIVALPTGLREELSAQMHWTDGDSDGLEMFGTLHKVPFFSSCDTLSMVHICAKMKIQVASPMQVDENGVRDGLIMEEGEIGHEMFLIISGSDVIIEKINSSDEKVQIGTCSMGDFFGELAALFPPYTFKDANGIPISGRVRSRSAYVSSAGADVTLGMLSYNDIYELRRERPEISEALIPYTTSVKSSVEKETGGPVQDMTPLDCFPELKYLDQRLDRIEALLSKRR